MPAKKAQAKTSKTEDTDKKAPQEPAPASDGPVDDKATEKGNAPKKRKAEQSTESSKAPRRSARGTSSPSVPPVKILQFLLSPSSLDLCRPKEEIEDLKTRGPDTRTYSSSVFTPFEELLCAVILSRPIGHMLGVRSIRTIFNAPYKFTTPQKIEEAGNEGCREALDKARTQHRQKTAEELVILANAVVEHLGNGDDDVSLEKVREDSGYDMEKAREMMKKHVKGLGKTGLDIFARRIQGAWKEFYPFIDERTAGAVESLGLPSSAEALRDVLDEHWSELETKDIEAKDEDEKRRRAFVRILERAVGASLEGNVDSVKAQAA